MRMWRQCGVLAVALVAALCTSCLGGCAQVVIITDGQPPQSELKLGVLAIDVAPSSKNTIISTSGIGLLSTPGGSTLGYANARIVRIGEECRVVIATKDFDAIREDEEALRLLSAAGKACPA